jgi:hypothetical protein
MVILLILFNGASLTFSFVIKIYLVKVTFLEDFLNVTTFIIYAVAERLLRPLDVIVFFIF